MEQHFWKDQALAWQGQRSRDSLAFPEKTLGLLITPINTDRGKPPKALLHHSVSSAAPALSGAHPDSSWGMLEVAGRGALTAAEPVVGGELQGTLGAVPALPPKLELALLHPAVRPGRHAAGVGQVSLAREKEGVKTHRELPFINESRHKRIGNPFPWHSVGPICSGKEGSLATSYFPLAN